MGARDLHLTPWPYLPGSPLPSVHTPGGTLTGAGATYKGGPRKPLFGPSLLILLGGEEEKEEEEE